MRVEGTSGHLCKGGVEMWQQKKLRFMITNQRWATCDDMSWGASGSADRQASLGNLRRFFVGASGSDACLFKFVFFLVFSIPRNPWRLAARGGVDCTQCSPQGALVCWRSKDCMNPRASGFLAWRHHGPGFLHGCWIVTVGHGFWPWFRFSFVRCTFLNKVLCYVFVL